MNAAPRGGWNLPNDLRACEWQECVFRALTLAFPKIVPRLLDDGPRDRHDLAALVSVRDLLRRVADDKSAKALSAELRQRSVDFKAEAISSILRGTLSLNGLAPEERSRVLFQLSRFGRAGPYPTEEAVKNSLEQHKVDLTRVFNVPRRLRKSAFRFAARWAHGKTGVGRVSLGASAGADAPRSSGGWRQAAREGSETLRELPISLEDVPALRALLTPFFPEFTIVDPVKWGEMPGGALRCVNTLSAALFPWEKRYAEDLGFTLEAWEAQRELFIQLASSLIRMRAMKHFGEGQEPLRCRRVVVRERGGKVRVVTPLDSYASSVGVYLNSWLLSLLAQDPRVNPFEDPIEPDWPVREGELLRSADLTRASDLIPGPLAEALVRGLCRGQGLSGTSLEAALRCFARPVLVEDRDGSWLTTGAPLMGAGPTWPLLSLYNLWLATQSWQDQRIRIVGDDLFAVGSLASSWKYDRLLEATGGGVSVAKDTLGACAGCLVEKLCVVEAGHLKWLGTVSVGSFGTSSRVKRGGDEEPSFTRGAAASYAPGVPWLVSKVYEADFRRLRAVGLNPFIPREFGGPGFPGEPDQVAQALATLKPYWARALRVVMSQGRRSAPLLLKLLGPWQSRSVGSHPALDSWVKEEVAAWHEELGREVDSERVTKVSLDEFERQVAAPLTSAFDLFEGFPSARRRVLSPRSVAASLRKVLGELNSLVPFPRLTDRPVNLAKGLATFLAESRGEYFIVPPTLRPTLGVGAARVGGHL